MTDRPDNHAPDDLDAVLTRALDHRAGGSFAEAASPTGTSTATDARLAAIEATVAAGRSGQQRTVTFLAIAAAVTLVLFVSIAVARGTGDGNEVQSVGGDTTSSTSAATTTLASGPGSTTPNAGTSVSPAGDIRNVDVRNFTYPTSICPPSLTLFAPTFTLVDGESRTIQRWPDGGEVSLVFLLDPEVLYGDVTGDGVDEAIVQIMCAPEGTDGVKDDAVIVSSVNGVPTVIGSLSVSGTATPGLLHRADGAPVNEIPWEQIDSMQAVDGQLRVRWLQTESPMGYQNTSTRKVTVTYLWDGSTFVPVGQSDVEVLPPRVDPTPTTTPTPTSTPPTDPPPPPTTAPPLDQAIRSADLRNVVVPLAHEGRTSWQAVCYWRFGDLPVTDTRLVNGSAVIRDGSGNPLDASISMPGEVQYAEVTGDIVEDAVVRMRCTKADVTVDTFAVFALRNGSIQMIDSLQAFPGAAEGDATSATVIPGMSVGSSTPTLPNNITVEFDYSSYGLLPLAVQFYWEPSECRFRHGDRPAGLDYAVVCP